MATTSIFKIFIYLFMAVLGLRCYMDFSVVAASGGCSLVAAPGLPVACLVVAQSLISCGSQALQHRLNSTGARAQLFQGLWDLSGSGIESVSPTLAGRFFTTEPPGKLTAFYIIHNFYLQTLIEFSQLLLKVNHIVLLLLLLLLYIFIFFCLMPLLAFNTFSFFQ